MQAGFALNRRARTLESTPLPATIRRRGATLCMFGYTFWLVFVVFPAFAARFVVDIALDFLGPCAQVWLGRVPAGAEFAAAESRRWVSAQTSADITPKFMTPSDGN